MLDSPDRPDSQGSICMSLYTHTYEQPISNNIQYSGCAWRCPYSVGYGVRLCARVRVGMLRFHSNSHWSCTCLMLEPKLNHRDSMRRTQHLYSFRAQRFPRRPRMLGRPHVAVLAAAHV